MTLEQSVAASLAEDVGSGDITAALIAADKQALATVITREEALIVGQPWFVEVFRQLDAKVDVSWLVAEGDWAAANQPLAELRGAARSLLTGERCALNWLQTLSGVATVTARYVEALRGTKTKLLDTRKTIPGLRHAEKYAVAMAGGQNHRMGLYDAYLIKENHIASAGSIAQAVVMARQFTPDKPIEVEVENLQQLQEALDVGVDSVLLDNFSLAEIKQAVQLTAGRSKLEVSGGVNLETIRAIAMTGVDYISVGALTKHVHAVDLSMRLECVF